MHSFDIGPDRAMGPLMALAIACVAGSWSAVAQPAWAQTSYGGRCTAACVRQVLPLPSEQCFADTGSLPSTGGNLAAAQPSVSVGVDIYAAANLTASAVGSGGTTTCSSAQDQVSAFGGLLVAASVRADAQAGCAGASGSSTISGLVLAGLSVGVTGAANQVVSVPGVATLVINEQITGVGGTDLTVNALHLNLATGEELILCSAHAAVVCSVPDSRSSWGTVKSRFG